MKKSKSKIVLSLFLVLGLVFSQAPLAFATSNSPLENSLSSGWSKGSNSSNWGWWSSPSGSSTSWFTVFPNMLADWFQALYYSITGSTSRSVSGGVSLFSKFDSLVGYVDDIESSISKVSNLPAASWFTNISSYVDGLESTLDTISSRVNTTNSRLNSVNTNLGNILSAIQNVVSDFDLTTSQGFIWTKYDGTQSTITSGTSLTDLVGMLGGASGENSAGIYSKVSNIDNYLHSSGSGYLYLSATRLLNLVNRWDANIPDIENYTAYLPNISEQSNGIHSDTSGILSRLNGNDSFAVSYIGINNSTATPMTRDNSLSTIKQNGNNFMQYISWRNQNRIGSYSNSGRDVTNLGDMVKVLNNNLVQSFNAIYSPFSWYPYQSPDYSNGNFGTDNSVIAYSLMDSLYFINRNLSSFAGRLGFMLADDSSIAAKKANANQSEAVVNGFTGSGSASASVSDFNGVKDGVSSLKSSFSSSASPSAAFTPLSGSGDNWEWFSQTTLDSLDNTVSGDNNRLFKSSVQESDTPLLDEYYSYLFDFLGVNNEPR